MQVSTTTEDITLKDILIHEILNYLPFRIHVDFARYISVCDAKIYQRILEIDNEEEILGIFEWISQFPSLVRFRYMMKHSKTIADKLSLKYGFNHSLFLRMEHVIVNRWDSVLRDIVGRNEGKQTLSKLLPKIKDQDKLRCGCYQRIHLIP